MTVHTDMHAALREWPPILGYVPVASRLPLADLVAEHVRQCGLIAILVDSLQSGG